MAGTLTACPRSESVPADMRPAADEAAPPRAGLAAVGRPGPGPVRLLQGAVLIHAGALIFALVLALPVPQVAVLAAGLLALLVALSVAPLSALSEADRAPGPALASTSPSSSAGLSPQVGGSGVSPTPLPFMGERIVLDPKAAPLTGLARAARRLRRMPSVRSHPWNELVARVSHDLRTPLNAVIGFSDVLEAELLGPVGHPRYREYARHIRDCGRELLKSAEDTLAITCLLDHDPTAAIESGVDLKAVVDEAWAFHADPLNGHGLSLEADIPEGLEILIDRRPMRQILINLFAEAVRRSDARGTVGLVVTVGGDLAQIEVFLRGRPHGGCVGQASLPICLARALLELNGAALVEVDDPLSTWRAVTVLSAAAQRDFFAVAASPAQEPVHLC